MNLKKALAAAFLAAFCFSVLTYSQIRVDEIVSPSSAKMNRDRGLNMLKEIKGEIKQRYYDKNFRGIDLDEEYKKTAEKIKTMDANWQIFRAIAQFVLNFDDSHTIFYPPSRSNRVQYGFSVQMIGQNCFVVDVKKGSDAEAKGLKVGDLIVGIDKYNPTRENLWKMNYILYSLDPQETIKIYVLNSDKTERELVINASFKTLEDRKKEAEKKKKEKRENPYKCIPVNSEIIACKLLTFSVDKKFIDKMMNEASKYKKMILDLRGNGGGYVKIEEYLTSHFFDREVKIATFVTREKSKDRIAKPRKENAFSGELSVLIDSESGSASEVFARVIQLEKRGKVIGDVSAGAVMTSNYLSMLNQRGVEEFATYSFYGVSITIADLIMSDGNRLEKVGVIPDILVGPTGKALFEGADPVLAFSAQLLGSNLDQESAGKFEFLHKRAEDEEAESEEEEGGE